MSIFAIQIGAAVLVVIVGGILWYRIGTFQEVRQARNCRSDRTRRFCFEADARIP